MRCSGARTVFDQLMQSVRTVIDFDRFESGQMQLKETQFSLGDVAAEALEEARRHAAERRGHGGAGPPTYRSRKAADWR